MNPWTIQVKGLAIGAITAVSLLAVCALLVAAAILPEQGIDVCVLVCCAVGALFGGATVARSGKRGAFWGMCTGAILAAVLGLSGFLLYSNLEASWCAAVACAWMVGGGAAGVLNGGRGRKRRG